MSVFWLKSHPRLPTHPQQHNRPKHNRQTTRSVHQCTHYLSALRLMSTSFFDITVCGLQTRCACTAPHCRCAIRQLFPEPYPFYVSLSIRFISIYSSPDPTGSCATHPHLEGDVVEFPVLQNQEQVMQQHLQRVCACVCVC